MPQIAYDGVPGVSASSSGRASPVSISVSPDAFGAPQARATGLLGGELEKAGERGNAEAQRWQEIQNASEANELGVVQASNKVGDLINQFTLLQGKQAQDALPKFQQDMAAARDEILGQASNPAVKRQLEQLTGRMFSYGLHNASRHAATEIKRYVNGAAVAAVDVNRRSAMASSDQKEFEDRIVLSEKVIRDNLAANGKSPEEIDNAVAEEKGKLWGTRLNYLAQTGHSKEALELYEQKKDVIPADVRPTVEASLLKTYMTYGAKDIADQVMSSSSGYEGKLIGKESGGKNVPNAEGTSSAFGVGQITDGTWSRIKKLAPDLGLPASVQDASVDQQKQALRVLTADNAKILRANNIPATEKNVYMAHFLGPQGAVDFISALQDSPNDPARKFVDKASVAANRSVFYHADGTAKTVREVYDAQTKRFSDAPITQARGSEASLVEQAKVAAAKAFPPEKYGDRATDFQNAVVNQVRTKYNLDVQLKRDEDVRNMTTVWTRATQENVKSIDDILEDKDASAAYNAMGPKEQQSLRNYFDRQARANANEETPERSANYDKLHGMALTDPKGFMAVDLGNEERTRTGAKKLANLRDQISKNALKEPAMMGLVSQLKANGLFDKSDVNPVDKKNNEKLHMFVGALHDLVMGFKGQEKRDPNADELKKLAGSLFQQKPGWFGGSSPVLRTEVPKADKDTITEKYRARYGRPPTEKEIMSIYNRGQASEALK